MARKLPPLSEMERIEQSMLGEKLDELLDRIEKEDVAFVITEDGKDKAVLCPYRRFEENFPVEIGSVVISAIRHEISAESENADAVRQLTLNHSPSLDERTLAIVVSDIEHHLPTLQPDSFNYEAWRQLQATLQNEIKRRGADRQ